MAESRVPIGLLRTTARAGHSKYMPKLVRWYSKDHSTVGYRASTAIVRRDFHLYSSQSGHKDPAFSSNISKDLLRFWAGGTNKTSTYAICRACNVVLNSSSDRSLESQMKAHQKERSCTLVLVAAYKLLLEKKACAMCSKQTDSRKWGVPLCDISCMKDWTYRSQGGMFLRDSITEAKRTWENYRVSSAKTSTHQKG